ncbi:hypothetical protein EVAR_38433_1 [Eumeta japonica]|uniref:Uncharacterized protein n=1 Tax=Eumeta variegata TaxID=151549 RepID=A0A4C1WWD1_EUMVA|nr:hypothetical protein EVAR_38433_1 [Eumeta japonica]
MTRNRLRARHLRPVRSDAARPTQADLYRDVSLKVHHLPARCASGRWLPSENAARCDFVKFLFDHSAERILRRPSRKMSNAGCRFNAPSALARFRPVDACPTTHSRVRTDS